MKFKHLVCILAVVGFAIASSPFAGVVAAEDKGEKKPAPITVAKILDVQIAILESEPPSLAVTAVGEVPTLGYENATLKRRVYVAPPKDGIQEYDLTAVPPAGVAAQQVSQVKALDVWKDYKKEAPWLKGVRIYGVDKGVKEEPVK